MVPDKFNMVDMEGIDLIESQEVAIPGLYEKLVESITQCRYQCLYNWKFNGIIIPPTYVEMVSHDGSVFINEGVYVDEEDVIHISTIEPPQPVIEPLSVDEDGIYTVPEGVVGFNPVTVEVPFPTDELDFISTSSGDSLTGWYSTRTITRVLNDGSELLALPCRFNNGYTTMAFYTLRDLDVSEVISGDYTTKATITGIEFPDSTMHDIFAYGGMNGAGMNPNYLYFVKTSGFGTCGSIFRGSQTGENYAYGPTTDANGGNAFNAMSTELKNVILSSLLNTI